MAFLIRNGKRLDPPEWGYIEGDFSKQEDVEFPVQTWNDITDKPFKTIGNGLKTYNDQLSLNTDSITWDILKNKPFYSIGDSLKVESQELNVADIEYMKFAPGSEGFQELDPIYPDREDYEYIYQNNGIKQVIGNEEVGYLLLGYDVSQGMDGAFLSITNDNFQTFENYTSWVNSKMGNLPSFIQEPWQRFNLSIASFINSSGIETFYILKPEYVSSSQYRLKLYYTTNWITWDYDDLGIFSQSISEFIYNIVIDDVIYFYSNYPSGHSYPSNCLAMIDGETRSLINLEVIYEPITSTTYSLSYWKILSTNNYIYYVFQSNYNYCQINIQAYSKTTGSLITTQTITSGQASSRYFHKPFAYSFNDGIIVIDPYYQSSYLFYDAQFPSYNYLSLNINLNTFVDAYIYQGEKPYIFVFDKRDYDNSSYATKYDFTGSEPSEVIEFPNTVLNVGCFGIFYDEHTKCFYSKQESEYSVTNPVYRILFDQSSSIIKQNNVDITEDVKELLGVNGYVSFTDDNKFMQNGEDITENVAKAILAYVNHPNGKEF